LFGRSLQSQIAQELVFVAFFVRERSRFKGNLGKSVGVEKLGRLQVLVAIGLVRVYAIGVYRQIDFGVVEILLVVRLEIAFKNPESARNGGNDEVFYLEVYFGVGRVYFPKSSFHINKFGWITEFIKLLANRVWRKRLGKFCGMPGSFGFLVSIC
jgi:hypothetical protein